MDIGNLKEALERTKKLKSTTALARKAITKKLVSIAERLSQQCGTLYHRVRLFEPPVAEN